MYFLKTLEFLMTHPMCQQRRFLSIRNFLLWQIISRLGAILSIDFLVPFVENTKVIAHQGETGISGSIYAGLHEFEDMSLILHFLRSDDLFFDVGANIGSYTLLAAGSCESRVIAIEPVSITSQRLLKNILINQLSTKVVLLQKAAGEKSLLLK